MQNTCATVLQEFLIHVIRHEDRLLLGTSPDLPGLIHTARSDEQFEAEIAGAVREVLEATGVPDPEHLSEAERPAVLEFLKFNYGFAAEN